MKKVSFIAEISSNHNRDVERCLDFVDCAADIGCDSVKFQLFKIDQLFSPEILSRSEDHRKRKEWELPVDFLPHIAQRAKAKNIKFGCTPFYLKAVEELFAHVDFYKIASYELLWDELLIECAQTQKPVILSTGMATLPEVQHAVEVLKNAGATDLTVLHCVSSYPTKIEECNLSAMETMRHVLNCPVGWSDHSVDAGVIARAVHRFGAKTIEFHLDLDRAGKEFKGGHCWLPNEMKKVISLFSIGTKADGTGVKHYTDSEAPERVWRADPSDGLRPFKEIRADWRP